MSQNYTVLLDLDGTLVDTAPDLMMAHNHVMKKFGYDSKTTEEIRNLVGKGAGVLQSHVPDWLKRAPLSGLVLALAEARRTDGGSGAFYVLLRRRR